MRSYPIAAEMSPAYLLYDQIRVFLMIQSDSTIFKSGDEFVPQVPPFSPHFQIFSHKLVTLFPRSEVASLCQSDNAIILQIIMNILRKEKKCFSAHNWINTNMNIFSIPYLSGKSTSNPGQSMQKTFPDHGDIVCSESFSTNPGYHRDIFEVFHRQ